MHKRSRPTYTTLVWLLLAAIVLQLLPPAPAARAQTAGNGPALTNLRFDAVRYGLDACLRLSLGAAVHNRNPAVAETTHADVVTRGGADRERMTLREDGPDSGVFTSPDCLPLAGGSPAIGDGTLQVVAGDQLVAVAYEPGGQKPLALDVAMVDGGQAEGQAEVLVNEQILPKALRSTPGPDNEPDLPIAMVIDPAGVPALFSQDTVIYRPATDADLESFLKRRGGRVLAKIVIPADNQQPGNLPAGAYQLIRVNPAELDTRPLELILERVGVKGRYTYSSEHAVRLMAMIGEEQLAGSMVLPNAVVQYQSAPVSDDGADVFTQPWFDPRDSVRARVGAGQALSLLEVADRRSGTQVPVAIIDGGFAAPGGTDHPDYGRADPRLGLPARAFNELPQCDIDAVGGANCGPGRAAGPNPLPCSGDVTCNWHGQAMFSVAGAELNNGAGAAGVGAAVVDPMFFRVGFPYLFPVAGAINAALDRGARVINLSSGFPCQPLLFDLCDPLGASGAMLAVGALCALTFGALSFIPGVGLSCAVVPVLLAIPVAFGLMQAAVDRAERLGAVVVAAAGNRLSLFGARLGPYDVDEVRLIPCTIRNVICVGSLTASGDNLVKSDFSGFGASVDIYAPGEDLRAMPSPDSGGALTDTSGTSPATAFISGVAALIRSFGPGLSAAQLRAVLTASGCRTGNTARTGAPACRPGDAFIDAAPGGYVDVLETLKRAGLPAALRGCSAGWDELTAPADGRGTAIPLTLSGTPPTASISGDLSIHALPGDEDWYRFRIPAASAGGAGSADVSVTLSFAAEAGNLRMEIFGPTPSAPALASISGTSGRATFRGLLFTDRDHFVRVTAAAPTVRGDTCYGNTLTVRVESTGPAGDRFEHNESRTTAATVNNWTRSDSRSSVSETTVWRLRLDGLSLHTTSDRDFFSTTLPTITGAECRAPDGPDLLEPMSDATLTMRVLPDGVLPAGEHLRLYQGSAVSEFAWGRPTQQHLDCPHSVLTDGVLQLSFGERTGERSNGLRYSLELEYRLTRGMGVPEWVREVFEEGRGFFMGCGRGAGGLPFCPENHVIIDIDRDLTRLPDLCLADGCPEFGAFYWPGGAFDLSIVAPPEAALRLLDEQRLPVGIAMPDPPLLAQTDEEDVSRLRLGVADLAEGWYALEIGGPSGEYRLEFSGLPAAASSRIYLPLLMR